MCDNHSIINKLGKQNNKLSLTSNISFDRNILETNIRNLKKSIEKLNAINNSYNFDKDIMIKYNLFVENSLILYANNPG